MEDCFRVESCPTSPRSNQSPPQRGQASSVRCAPPSLIWILSIRAPTQTGHGQRVSIGRPPPPTGMPSGSSGIEYPACRLFSAEVPGVVEGVHDDALVGDLEVRDLPLAERIERGLGRFGR